MKRTLKDYVLLMFKGMAMGAADVIPGVSGGTIAFISGIYEELINSIKSINLTSLKLLFTGRLAGFWKSINGNFLLGVFTGILISVFTLASLLKYLLENQPVLVWSFFFGLILASAVLVLKVIRKKSIGAVITFLVGGVVAFLITVITPTQANTALWFVFLSGAIAICAMILPGISGSFILVLLGMYKYILESVTGMHLDVLFIFTAGAVIGLIAFSNVLSWLFRRYHDLTVALLAGFMIGSLNKVWPWKKVMDWGTDHHGNIVPLIEENVWPGMFGQLSPNDIAHNNNDPQFVWAIVAFHVGIALIIVFDRLPRYIQKRQAQSEESHPIQ